MIPDEIQNYLEIEEYCQECDCKECSEIFTRFVMLWACLIYNKEELIKTHIQECHSDEYSTALKKLEDKNALTCSTCLNYINEYHMAVKELDNLGSAEFQSHANSSHDGIDASLLYAVERYNKVAELYANYESTKISMRLNIWPI